MSTINGLGSSMNMMMQAMSMQRPDKEQMFGKVDTDGSGVVEESELAAFVADIEEKTEITVDTEQALADYDEDGDGGLSQEELEAMLGTYLPAPPMMGDETDGQGPSMPGPMGGPPNPEELFASIDTDSSGTVNSEELTAFLEELAEKTGIELDSEEAISTYDSDGDGELSAEELKQMMEDSMPRPPAFPPHVLDAYGKNSEKSDNGESSAAQLRTLFGDDEEESTVYSPIDVTA